MHTAEIRRTFLDHFRQGHGHMEAPSASLIPSSYDPSVLLTIAGMQPFKPYFSGLEQPPATRMTSSQKCFRTADIDEVGLTARHLTFFEMLGNFSFGDYFKQGAIEMAWELVVEGLGFDVDRLWATVHAGDRDLGLGPDEEALELWQHVGVPAARIVQLGDDNFWKAGPTGPCGPCSELYYDRGARWGCGGAACRPGCDCDRFLEFYNLVFMQYSRDATGALAELPSRNIDTGMGLERVSSLLQGNVSVFEIDAFAPVIRWAEHGGGQRYGSDPRVTKALRVLVDHGRGMTFLASDGVTPGNEGRGYVLRRVMRRAIVQADRLGLYRNRRTGVLGDIAGLVVETFGEHYPELVEQRAVVAELLAVEEERFLRTLDKGSALLGEVLDRAAAGGNGETGVSGDDAFRLHDTFGFPVELTRELAGERGLDVDGSRFSALMHEQRERGRAAGGSATLPVEQAARVVREGSLSRFVGYDMLATDAQVIAVAAVDEPAGEGGDDGAGGDRRVLVKLSETPFYAAGGGQVSDTGMVTGPHGRGSVEAVVRYDGDQVLVLRVDGELRLDDTVRAEVDPRERRATEANHTATHLLHAALREQLGDHVRQAGSLVEPGRLRFDFTHPAALDASDLDAVEAMVNRHIAAAEHVVWEEIDLEEARARGAMMLFGEKYGDRVRLVQVGDGWSRELCGGTHVRGTGDIRVFLVLGESSVGSGTRRIEAVTGEGALAWLRARARAADQAARAAGVDIEQLPGRVAELARDNRALERELSSLRSGGALEQALAARREVGPFTVVAHRDDALGGDELLDLADRVRGQLGDMAVVVLGSGAEDKVQLVVAAAPGAVAAGAHAGNLVRQVAGVVGGGGGGRPAMARAGGRDVSRLDEALEAGVAALAAMSAAAAAGA